MQDMTTEEYRAFITEGTRTGKLATVRADGRPHVTPIWFVLEGDDLYFNTWHTSVKGKNLQRDGKCSLCVDEAAPPYSFVIVEGEAEIVEVNDVERVAWSTRIAHRYMGDDLAESYGKRNGVEGELLICLKPTKIIAKKNVSD